MRINILLIMLLFIMPAFSQKRMVGDSLLNNERTMDRPIIPHDGQFRISSYYTFATLSSRFNADGDKIKLSDQGNIGLLHHVTLDLQYGFFGVFELVVGLNYQACNLREKPVCVFTLYEIADINQVRKETGMQDLFIGTVVLLPWTNISFDFALSAGVTIPTASNEPDQPDHSAESYFYVDNPTVVHTEVNYLYNDNLGVGTTTTVFGSQFKYRFTDFAISGGFNYRFPISECESITWTQRLVGTNEFVYDSKSFQYRPPDQYFAKIASEYQLYPWINIFIEMDYQMSKGGWSEATGKRVAFRNQMLASISPGIEILLTSRFWLRQRLIIGMVGENSFSPVGVETRLLYNLFPF